MPRPAGAGIGRLLRPGAVAVIGASADPTKRGNQAVRALREDGYPHPIYPVNPKGGEVLGLEAYRSVADLPGPVDLALVAVPAAAVPEVLAECAAAGVAGAVVVAVGFGESGVGGGELERRLREIARDSGLRVIGPNTSGLFNLSERLNLVGVRGVPRGPLALVSHSGNMLLGLLEQDTAETGLGFSVYVGVGNEVDVLQSDCLAFLRDDPDTGAVLMYCEGFRDGRSFLREARATALAKPVVMVKAGRSAAGAHAARSHTGALAGRPEVADAVLRQAGVVVVDRSDELLPVAAALLTAPASADNRVAVLADGGGHATLAVDAIAATPGLDLAVLAPPTVARLAGLLPAAATPRNPVDVAGGVDRDPGLFVPCLEALLADEGVDLALVVGLFGGYHLRFTESLRELEERAAQGLAEVAAAAGKPLLVHSVYAARRTAPHAVLRRRGVPVHGSLDITVRAAAALVERGRFLESAASRTDLVLPASWDAVRLQDAGEGVEMLPEHAVRTFLADQGIGTGPWALARTADEAAAQALRFGGPVALKVVSPDVPHKSDAGGVLLEVAGVDAVRSGFSRLVAAVSAAVPGARVLGVLLAPMAPPGVELIVGAAVDPTFGPVVTVGLGGVLVAVLGDVAFRAAPISPPEAAEMLTELRGQALLDGHRGGPVVDRSAVARLLVAVADLVATHPEIVELDLNPVIAHSGGLTVADARMVVRT
ncbi:MAG TPA: acetate--CoA ligase family protein [Actinomycetes bacterium]|nr:acetate--CoA ligase family protein [Actinomycetes bacterium]